MPPIARKKLLEALHAHVSPAELDGLWPELLVAAGVEDRPMFAAEQASRIGAALLAVARERVEATPDVPPTPVPEAP